MKRALRWVAYVLGGLVAVVLIAYAGAYVLSERVLKRTYDVPAARLSVPTDDGSIAEGRRLATVHGCLRACHGKEGEGAVMFDEPMVARVIAPNLTAAVRRYDDGQLAAIIRNGVRPDGRSMVIMPSEAFVALTDQDLGLIIAALRSLPQVDGPGPSVSFGPMARVGFALGKFRLAAQLIADTVPPPEAKSEQAKFGRYLARTTCAGCHGTSLNGDSNPDFTSPSLAVVVAYSPEAFVELMRTGTPIGGRKLDVMGPTARAHFAQMTDAEIAALYGYLHELPLGAPAR